MSRELTRFVRCLALLAIVAAAGCSSTMPIRKLLDDPSQYDKKTVRVKGEVTNTAGVLGYGVYRIDDGTGTLPVLTRENGAPRKGAKVALEGEFRAGFTFGGETAAVLLEKSRSSD